MLKLSKIVRKNGYTYKQVKRADGVAIYSQTSKEGNTTSYEVFKIRKAYACIAPNGKSLPEREKFPSNEDFGRHAWSFPKLELAEATMQTLLAGGTPFKETCADVQQKKTVTKKAKVQSASTAKVTKIDGHTVRWYGRFKIVVNTPNYKTAAPKPFLQKVLKAKKVRGVENMTIQQMCEKLFA